jgi:hypothetical protein
MASMVVTPAASGVAGDISTIAASLNEIAAPWYNAVTFNTPVVPVPTSATQAALQQAAIQQQQQQALLSIPGIGPLLAGLLANPTLLLVIIAAVIGGIVLVVKR